MISIQSLHHDLSDRPNGGECPSNIRGTPPIKWDCQEAVSSDRKQIVVYMSQKQ